MRKRGFTLLEVLIAVAVLVLAVVSILPLFAVGAASHKQGVDQSNVAWIAPRIAAFVQQGLYDADPQDIKDGKWEEYGETYTYDATFKRLEGSNQGDPCGGVAFLLHVRVKWSDTGEGRFESYETVVLRKLRR
jgi:prepilin-type N-terminal cleavage/methylation domain-containing protein